MAEIRIALTVMSQTALSIGASGGTGMIADKSIVRDGWNRPIIPGSHVKGKLRGAAEQLLRGLGKDIPDPFDRAREKLPTLVSAIFGSSEQRSPLHFADLVGFIGAATEIDTLRTSPEQQRSQIRPSLTINRQRGTAEEGRLFFQEVAPETMCFYAQHAIVGESSAFDQSHVALLWAALHLSPRWGGAKSRGLGWSSVDVQMRVDQIILTEADLRQAVRDLVLNLELP